MCATVSGFIAFLISSFGWNSLLKMKCNCVFFVEQYVLAVFLHRWALNSRPCTLKASVHPLRPMPEPKQVLPLPVVAPYPPAPISHAFLSHINSTDAYCLPSDVLFGYHIQEGCGRERRRCCDQPRKPGFPWQGDPLLVAPFCSPLEACLTTLLQMRQNLPFCRPWLCLY